MKSDRLLSELMLLQAHGRLSTREIAERLEVSERTAHRDMEALCVAGIPLRALRGAQGGWELEKGWRTRVPGLSDAELHALLMVQPGGLGGGRLTVAAQRAFDKLMASLPAPMKEQAESIRARLYIDPTGWHSEPEDLTMLPVVQDALARDVKLTFNYTRADGETSARTVDPLGMVCKQMAWYLVARTPAGMRTFRVSRMRDALTLTLPLQRPAKFDLETHWKQSTAQLKEEQQRMTATVALSPAGLRVVKGWCPMTEVERHPAAKRLAKDWRIFEVRFENIRHAQFVVLGMGSQAEALGPEELCAGIAAEVRRMAKRKRAAKKTRR